MKGNLSGFGDKEIKGKNINSRVDNNINSKLNSNIQDDVLKQYENIKNMSQSEAQNQLFNEVLKQKQNGTFNFEGLSKQVESLKGYLPEKDYNNLKKLLESLR